MSQETISPDTLGFLRVAAVVPALRVADIRYNTQVILDALREATLADVG